MITVLIFFALLSAIGCFLYVIAIGYGIFFGAPYVGTSKETAREMLRMAHVNQNDVLLDPGCGTGNILMTAMREFRVKKVIGYDVNPILIIYARIRFLLARHSCPDTQVEFYTRSAIDNDIRTDATVIAMYMLPIFMKRFEKVWRQNESVSRIVSHGFTFEGQKAQKETRIHNATLRLYTRNGVMAHDYERGNST